MITWIGHAGLLHGRSAEVLKQPEVGAFVREVLRLLAPKSTQEEVQEAGAAAGVQLPSCPGTTRTASWLSLSPLANSGQAPC